MIPVTNIMFGNDKVSPLVFLGKEQISEKVRYRTKQA